MPLLFCSCKVPNFISGLVFFLTYLPLSTLFLPFLVEALKNSSLPPLFICGRDVAGERDPDIGFTVLIVAASCSDFLLALGEGW